MIVECQSCDALVNGEVVASYDHWEDEGPPGRYSFVKCPKCNSPILVAQENFGSGWDEPFRLYPPNVRVNPNLPRPIRIAYIEALSCLKAKAFTATAIMCRKTLEGICAEHGIRERNLVKALKKMKEQGVIESRLLEWADALRISGNEAAHDVNVTTSAEDARDLTEFTNALMEYVFTFQDRFNQFQARRNALTPNPGAAPDG